MGDLGRWVGDAGRVCAYVPGQPGSYGRGKMGDERETVKVGGLGELDGLQEHRHENQTLALTELRHTQGVSSVSELEEEGERERERETWIKTRGGR